MNVLELRREHRDDWPGGALRILIDGNDLVALAREAELPSAAAEGNAELAGGYAGLVLSHIPDLAAHLLGRSEPPAPATGRVELLVCASCGESGCWPLEASVEADDRRVRWSNFEQPHRPLWRHDGLGPFEFDRRQFDEAVARVTRTG